MTSEAEVPTEPSAEEAAEEPTAEEAAEEPTAEEAAGEPTAGEPTAGEPTAGNPSQRSSRQPDALGLVTADRLRRSRHDPTAGARRLPRGMREASTDSSHLLCALRSSGTAAFLVLGSLDSGADTVDEFEAGWRRTPRSGPPRVRGAFAGP
jgi:hypothetical protein